MKEKRMVRGTPIIPSFCAILQAVLWYVYFYYYNGAWNGGIEVALRNLSPLGFTLQILRLAGPILLFVTVLFLAEVDLRWMTVPVLIPIAVQTITFAYYLQHDSYDYIFEFPFQFFAAFLVGIVLLLTVTGTIRCKWICVTLCGAAVAIPLLLTLLKIGEFSQTVYNDMTLYYWSDYLYYALYYIALGALAVKMQWRTPVSEASELSAMLAAEEAADSEPFEDGEDALLSDPDDAPEDLPPDVFYDSDGASDGSSDPKTPEDGGERPEG